MALVKRRMSQKKVRILIGFLVVAFAAAAYYLFGTGSTSIVGPGEDPVAQRLQSELTNIENTRQTILPSLEGLFNDVRFQQLRQYGVVPVEPGKTGRPNPFLPF